MNTFGEYIPGGFIAPTDQAIEDYTTYDRGALCEEIDHALGDLIERTMHRYMPKKTAHNVRRTTISGLADKVIEYDQTHGKSNSNPS